MKIIEKAFEVQPIVVKYICDLCKMGEMIPSGNNNWSSNPAKIEHKCNYCGNNVFCNVKYPVITYRATTE